MLGYAHALSGMTGGAAALLVAAPLSRALPQVAAWLPVPDPATDGPLPCLAFIIVCGGMALAPDLDHPGSTIARFWGPVSNVVAVVVGFVFRGHRRGTHDIVVGPAVFAALAWLAADLWWWGQVTVLALAVGLGLRAVGAAIPGREAWDHPALNFALSWVPALLLVGQIGGTVPDWAPSAVAIGCVTHILGDLPTDGGVPVPLTWLGRVRLVSLSPVDADNPVLNGGAAVLSLTATAWLVGPWAVPALLSLVS